jgi:hypothetical protein
MWNQNFCICSGADPVTACLPAKPISESHLWQILISLKFDHRLKLICLYCYKRMPPLQGFSESFHSQFEETFRKTTHVIGHCMVLMLAAWYCMHGVVKVKFYRPTKLLRAIFVQYIFSNLI